MPDQVVPHVRAKLHLATADWIVLASGSNGIQLVDALGIHKLLEELYVQLSGHFAIFVGSIRITICGLITYL